MSQSVQLDMEVLQRIKFLMEYDVMKTSSENILFEQIEASKVPNLSNQFTYNQELAKIAGYGNVTPQKADELAVAGKLVYAAQQGLPLKTLMGTDDESKRKRDIALYKPDPSKTGTIDLPSTHVSKMYSQIPQDLKDQNLEELTIKVRNIMTGLENHDSRNKSFYYWCRNTSLYYRKWFLVYFRARTSAKRKP
jgi:hypothetical protein